MKPHPSLTVTRSPSMRTQAITMSPSLELDVPHLSVVALLGFAAFLAVLVMNA
jgi:hypothetical protein